MLQEGQSGKCCLNRVSQGERSMKVGQEAESTLKKEALKPVNERDYVKLWTDLREPHKHRQWLDVLSTPRPAGPNRGQDCWNMERAG